MVAYARDMVNTWENGAVRDIHEDMMTLTQLIIMKVLFSVDVLDNAKGASEAFNAMMQALGAQMSGIEAVLPNFVPTPTRTKKMRLKE